jgi:hypothetical protein
MHDLSVTKSTPNPNLLIDNYYWLLTEIGPKHGIDHIRDELDIAVLERKILQIEDVESVKP